MAGIVYVEGGDPTLGRLGVPITLATAGDAIPPGVWYVPGAWTAQVGSPPAPQVMPGPGIAVSDGAATLNAPGDIIPMGARGESWAPEWPWPLPWPLNL